MYKPRKSNYRSNYRGRNNGSDTPLSGRKDFEYTPPTPPSYSEDTAMIEQKAFRDLAFSGSIEVKSDPHSELSKASYPYNIIGKTNPVLDAKYSGNDNISGNSITQLQNSTKSQFLNLYDIGTVTKRLNYLYVSSEEGEGQNNLAYFKEMIKSIEQALSYGYSTMLTQLEFYTDKVVTDYPSIEGIDAIKKDRTGALLHYQSVLQNFVSPLAKYIQTRGLEQTLLNVGYRREAALITQLFGLLKKSAFISQMNSIGTSVLNEYFDDSWYKQVNTLLNISSKKTQGMVDPLITLSGAHKIVNCKFSNDDGETYYYNSATALKVTNMTYLKPETLTYVTGDLTLEELVANVNRLLDVYNIVRWARKLNEGTLNAATQPRDPSEYYEAINRYIKQIAVISASFATKMSSIRTFLDKMSQTGFIYWKRGQMVSIERVQSTTPTYNKLLSDVVASSYAGSSHMVFDQSTKRWKIFTLWDEHTGLAQFDTKSGGAFLTFSLRTLSGDDLDTVGSEYLIPILFAKSNTSNVNYNSAQFTNRVGVSTDVVFTEMTNEDVNEHPYFARLNPLLSTDLLIKVPTLLITESAGITASTQGQLNRLVSAGLHLMGTVFGYGIVKGGTISDGEITPILYHTIKSESIAFIDSQLDDVSNQMITFARTYAPFRVNTPDSRRTMGFGG